MRGNTMKTYDGCGTHLLMVFIAVVMFNSQPTAAQQVADKPNLDEAIATLRKVDPELLKNPDQSKWTKAEMNAAWDKMEAASTVIYKAGVCGADRVKEELKKLDDAKEKDDFFRLSAASLLYALGGPTEGKTVGAIWDTTPLDLHYNSVFFTACQASITQDPRVLPMLTACLKDRKGAAFIARHFLTMRWPRTQLFIWGMYGPKGLPVVGMVRKRSRLGTIEVPVEVLRDPDRPIESLLQKRPTGSLFNVFAIIVDHEEKWFVINDVRSTVQRDRSPCRPGRSNSAEFLKGHVELRSIVASIPEVILPTPRP
jgi:hypothetical protein